MVVVDPDHVTLHQIFDYRLSEFSVGAFVGLPGIFTKGYLAGVVVDQRPHDPICQSQQAFDNVQASIFPDSLANLL